MSDTTHAKDNSAPTIGAFAEELEVHVEDETKLLSSPKPRKHRGHPRRALTLPPPKIDTKRGTPTGATTHLHKSHSAFVLSSLDSSSETIDLSSSGFSTVKSGLRKTVSLDNIAGTTFTLGLDEDENGSHSDNSNVIAVSLADFEDFDSSRLVDNCCYCQLAGKNSPGDLLDTSDCSTTKSGDTHQSSDSPTATTNSSTCSITSDSSPGDTTLVVSSILVSCPSYSSLNATAEILPPLKLKKTPEEEKDIKLSAELPVSSKALPLSQTVCQHCHHRNHYKNFQHYRKKFVLKPQHSPLASLDPTGRTTFEYTTEVPQAFQSGHKLTGIEDKVAAKIRRKVSKHPPPLLPPQLESNFINSTLRTGKDNVLEVTVPNHVVLNHLATTSIKNDILAVASTSRYRDKFCKYSLRGIDNLSLTASVTQILYRPM